MTTFDIFPYDFLSVYLGGGLLCVVVGYLAKRRIRESKRWLAFFSILVAATIAPTCFPFVFGGWIATPAALATVVLFDRSNFPFALLCGALPILVVAGLTFVLLSRKYEHKVVA